MAGKETTPLTTSARPTYQSPPYVPPQPLLTPGSQAAVPPYAYNSSNAFPTINTVGASTPVETDTLESKLAYLGPNTNSSNVYRFDMPLPVTFDKTFPEIGNPSQMVDCARQINRTIYEFVSDIVHALLSIVFGIPWAIFVAFFVGMGRFMYTYMAGPMNQVFFILIASMAPSWRAFFRAGMDPVFESAALAFSNIQVRIGMEAKGRYKSISD
eukprot:m.62617 g.62617  ORF g.62617 m.62617 type:complete len:213 (+) comp13406_c0_seq1:575-1213(+)